MFSYSKQLSKTFLYFFASMQIKHIAQLQSSINKGTFFYLPSPTQPTYHSVTLALLNLARNCHLENYAHLNILQQITSIISSLVKFNSPLDCLAALDRQKFRQVLKEHVKKNKNDVILGDMALGIYPHKEATWQIRNSLAFRMDFNNEEEYEVGNKNWKLTRRVIQNYYKTASQQHRQCLEVLLAMPELRDKKYARVQWRTLWTQLYLMTNNILLNQDQNCLLVQKGQKFIVKLKEAIDFTMQSSNETTQQMTFRKIILKLVGFITKKFISKQQENDLKELDEIFNTLKQQNFPLLNTYLLSLMLLKDIFEKFNLKQASDHYRDKLNDFINQQQTQTNQKEVNQLISYLISHEQLPDYLFQNGLNFWEYKLDGQDYQYLAGKYLLDYSKLPDNFDWDRVFQHLSCYALENHILRAGKSWLKHKWAQHFISAVYNQKKLSNDRLFTRKRQQMRQIIRQFCQQWDCFNKIEIYGLRRSIHEVETLLTYHFNYSDELYELFLFPQDDQKYFVQILVNYMKFVKEENLINEKYNLFFSADLANNLLRIDSQLLDDYWSLWADLLLMKDSTLDALLKIEPTKASLLQKSELQDRTSTTNDRLFLKTE